MKLSQPALSMLVRREEEIVKDMAIEELKGRTYNLSRGRPPDSHKTKPPQLSSWGQPGEIVKVKAIRKLHDDL